MALQKIQTIKIDELRLWTENPRDPVDPESTDIEIIHRAMDENPSKWNLQKMLNEMGPHYDVSELPTVVFQRGVPIVYDGNRRIAVIKYLQNPSVFVTRAAGLAMSPSQKELKNIKEVPCNVCDLDTALTNVERKHVNAGTWGPLERDYFLATHRKEKKSLFVQFEEQMGGVISKNKKMNQGFIKKEVLTDRNLKQIGIHFDEDKGLMSSYSEEEIADIVEKITAVVADGKIDTRGAHRGKLKEALVSAFPDLERKIKSYQSTDKNKVIHIEGQTSAKKTPRSKRKPEVLFGGTLSLESGQVNDIYRDVLDLYEYYQQHKAELSQTFPSLIRMSLRLLVEAASTGTMDSYIKKNYTSARSKLGPDEKTSLSSYSITEKKLIELLHVGAHKYSASSNIDMAIAMSLIIGQMLTDTHGKNKN